jgi:signal transduction histidine kinase
VTIEGKLLNDDEQTSGLCQISVADDGIGFDEKYLDRIFTVFQRLHGRNEYEGTGVGLAVCRKIVERHNGTLTATSSPGQGTTFIVTLPVKQANDEAY